MESERVQFESGHFLHSLFANDVALLRGVGEASGVRIVARDGTLLMDGGDEVERDAIARFFRDLEVAKRRGLEITRPVFQMAQKAREEDGSAPILKLLYDARLLGSAKKPAVVAQTPGQLAYLEAMSENEVVFGAGSAGTGKTYLAMAMGLAALRDGDVNKVVLSRPAVEAGEALGFLPGDVQEKLAPYLRPLYDALYDMLDPEEVEKAIDRGQVEVAPLAYMRGRTLAKSFVILDEAQNTTPEQMRMFLTRLGMGSRCVVTGDPTQIDLGGRAKSGLAEALRILKGVKGVGMVKFEPRDVVRHPVVERIITAYEAEDTDG